jgi:hypothetical protein
MCYRVCALRAPNGVKLCLLLAPPAGPFARRLGACARMCRLAARRQKPRTRRLPANCTFVRTTAGKQTTWRNCAPTLLRRWRRQWTMPGSRCCETSQFQFVQRELPPKLLRLPSQSAASGEGNLAGANDQCKLIWLPWRDLPRIRRLLLRRNSLWEQRLELVPERPRAGRHAHSLCPSNQ